jgi:hypothetical protein
MIIVLPLSILLILTACIMGKIEEDPVIDLKFSVSNLTDDEFKSVGTKELEKITKNDFKNILLTIDVRHSNKISNRKIIMPNIEKIASDVGRYWFGESYSQDNTSENFATYNINFVLYSRGLNEQSIKDIYNLSEVKVSWTNSSSDKEEKLFKLGDIIQFK